MTRIGWYVHHHGHGHLSRMLAIAPHLDAQITCFSSLAAPKDLPVNCTWVQLDRDDDREADEVAPEHADPTVDGMLHWAPLGHAGHRNRFGAIAAAIASSPPDAFIIDVSVEVALFVRLLGIRTVVMAQPGIRDDEPHRLAYRSATMILAPWPGGLLAPRHLDHYRDRVVYTGGISRFEDRMPDAPSEAQTPATLHPSAGSGRDVLLLGSGGGGGVTEADIAEAAVSSGQEWHVIGAAPGATWTSDPWDEIRSARVVVAWAGQNSVADLASADAAAVIVPQYRPFDEQYETARAVERAGLAVVVPQWPRPDEWAELIERAVDLPRRWALWGVRGAAERAAAAIDRTARADG